MKRIAIVDTSDFDTYPVGGQLTSIKSFIKYIGLERSTEIELVLIGITRKKEEVDKEVYRLIGGKAHRFIPIYFDDNNPNNPKQSLRKSFMKALFKHRKLIRILKLDLAYIHTPEAFLPIKLAAPKLKLIIFSHGNFYEIFNHIRFRKYKNGFVKFFINLYITLMIKFSGHVFVLDTASYIEYRKHNKHVTKVLNSIDMELFKRNEPVKSAAIRALYVGRLSKNKNIDKIILAFKELPGRHQLKVIGDGEMYSLLDSMIKDNNLENQVTLAGRKTQEELVHYYQEANMLIINSDIEGVPMVLLEALASGLAIISTPVGGIPETIQDGVQGRFTDGTPSDIRQKMLEVLTDIEATSMRNREFAKHFRYQTVNKEICDTLFSGGKEVII